MLGDLDLSAGPLQDPQLRQSLTRHQLDHRGYLASLQARQSVKDYGFQFGDEGGIRAIKLELGFKETRVKQVSAWSRLFALFDSTIAALITLLTTSGAKCQNLIYLTVLYCHTQGNRRVLRLIGATIALIQQEPSLLGLLAKNLKLNLLYA